MSMYHSSEIRWFHNLEHRSDLETAFVSPVLTTHNGEDGLFVEDQTERTDSYFVLKTAPALGIKYRDHQLEIKVRVTDPLPVNITQNVNGCAENWLKHCYTDSSYPLQSLERDIQDDLVHVHKKRLMRQYILDGDTPVSYDFMNDHHSGSGCNVELALVTVRSDKFDTALTAITLAFEAFGRKEKTPETREKVAQFFFERFQTKTHFTLDNSLSYPAWLSQNLSRSKLNS